MGNGEITEFDFRFPFYENNNVVVLKNNKPATGYTIVRVSAGDGADIPYLGGKVVFESAPLPTDSIVISRKLPLSRVVDYQPLAKIEPKLLNQDMNYLMETLKDIYDELNAFVGQCKELADKNFVNALIGRLDYLNRIIESGGVLTHENAVSAITNCLTVVPQDIKLEIVDGAVVLKAGSKVYVPNGTGLFQGNIYTQDKSVSFATGLNGSFIIFAGQGPNSNIFGQQESCFYSGSPAPTFSTNIVVWYDTSANLIKFSNNGGSTWFSENYSFPLAKVTLVNGEITSIDQVFNGFGYIGSTVFVLPGVKCLIPNGKNADGTLNNTITQVSSVRVSTNLDSNNNKIIVVRTDGSFSQGNKWIESNIKPTFVENNNQYWYNPDTNKVFYYRSSTNNGFCEVMLACNFKTGADKKITSFLPKQTFHAVDYSDTEFIAHQSMTSDKYVDLKLGASGTQYTAPADGYVFLRGQTTVAGKAYGITNEITGMRNQIRVENSGIDFGVFMPVSVGQNFSVKYEGALASGYLFRFVFVNGMR